MRHALKWLHTHQKPVWLCRAAEEDCHFSFARAGCNLQYVRSQMPILGSHLALKTVQWTEAKWTEDKGAIKGSMIGSQGVPGRLPGVMRCAWFQ